MPTYAASSDGALEDAVAILLLLSRIPADRRTPAQARVHDVLLEQYHRQQEFGAGDGDAVRAAREEFYTMPAAS